MYFRFDRNYETNPNHFYFTDFERHNAEIAGFHLDRVLGFHRAIPTAGRKVNISSELEAHAQAKNRCFVGQCEYYCDTTHAICGEPDMKELSVQALLPDIEYAPRKRSRSPYRRTYNKRRQLALWQLNSSFCDLKVKTAFPYNAGRALLDLVDLYIFDFFMGNQDRHHYEYFSIFPGKKQASFLLHLDNGRGFGNSKTDDMDILAPLTQCCLIRPTTLRTLLDYYTGPLTLSDALRQSLSKDGLSPILAEKHYMALERRLNIVLKEVLKCLKKAEWHYEKVIMPFFFNPTNLSSSEHEEDSEKSLQQQSLK
ncbi:unnamed protein product [Soboliphyme baturini]|uniref:FAM20 C-terminal domain-containing protein n=1 Tax=Soboliphyme baturini TaxID=241478 RepID=A0A3P8GV77_9BILA|nr:unnamed protein product [Soboliphyme baturini]